MKKNLKRIFFIASKLPTRKKTIVFESFLGKQFSDNPKALYLYIRENYPEYNLYWSFDRKTLHKFQGRGLEILPRFGLKWIFTLARAEFWVTNSRLPLWLTKPKRTTYLQTWHGTPLKKLAADMEEVHMPGTSTERYKKNFIKESCKWDILISPNAYSTNIFKRAFKFDKRVIESGYPRNDILINSNNKVTIEKLKRHAGLPLDKKVILYAPTWRDDQYYSIGNYKFSLEMDLSKMKRELGSEYILVLRLHYLVAENLNLSGFDGFVYDFSTYGDINELFLMSDMLITDYSSVFFDYANLKRPIFFYVYDIEEYRDKLRGFYFNFECNAPGPLVKKTEELIKYIRKHNQANIINSDKYKEFHKKYCYLEDGESSRRVVENIFGQSSTNI